LSLSCYPKVTDPTQSALPESFVTTSQSFVKILSETVFIIVCIFTKPHSS